MTFRVRHPRECPLLAAIKAVYYAAAVLFLGWAVVVGFRIDLDGGPEGEFNLEAWVPPAAGAALAVVGVLHVLIARGIERGWALRLLAVSAPALVATWLALWLFGAAGVLVTLLPAFGAAVGSWRFLRPARA